LPECPYLVTLDLERNLDGDAHGTLVLKFGEKRVDFPGSSVYRQTDGHRTTSGRNSLFRSEMSQSLRLGIS